MTNWSSDLPADAGCHHCYHSLSDHADGKCLYHPTRFKPMYCTRCKALILDEDSVTSPYNDDNPHGPVRHWGMCPKTKAGTSA